MGRFYQGYEWAEVVTDRNTVSITGLSKLAASRTVTFSLNKPAVATGVVPSDDPRVNLPHIESGPDAPSVSYATVYPLTMLLRVVAGQTMVLLVMS